MFFHLFLGGFSVKELILETKTYGTEERRNLKLSATFRFITYSF
jgi:hypothetical protein